MKSLKFPRWLLPGGALLLLPGLSEGSDGLQEALRRLEADDVLVADAAVEELVAHGEAAVAPLLLRLGDSRRDVRAGALRALGLLGDSRAVGPIRELLRSSLDRTEPDTIADRYHRILAIQALGRLRAESAVELLREAATQEDPFERAHAGISLLLSGADPGYSLVRECLADTSMAIRNLAVQGIAESSDPRIRDLLLSMTADESWVVRDSALRALARRPRDAEIREVFTRGAEDPSWHVRRTVAEANRRAPAPR